MRRRTILLTQAKRARWCAAGIAGLLIFAALAAAGANLEIADSENHTALTRAVSLKRIDLVKILIAAKAELNRDVNSPLLIAYGANQPKIFEELLLGGANPYINDETGSPLLLTVMVLDKVK